MPASSSPGQTKSPSSTLRRQAAARRSSLETVPSPKEPPYPPRHGMTSPPASPSNARFDMPDWVKRKSASSPADAPPTVALSSEPAETTGAGDSDGDGNGNGNGNGARGDSKSVLSSALLGSPFRGDDGTKRLPADMSTSPRKPEWQPAAEPPPAVNAQLQLNQYRERLAQEMERREVTALTGQAPLSAATRFLPIQEEDISSPTPPTSTNSDVTTASTESGGTIRGAPTPNFPARTPSYPFPRMGTPAYVSSGLHRPFTTLSPTVAPTAPQGSFSGPAGLQDKVLSNPSTPASTMTFHPAGYSQSETNLDFPSPNLYELTLMLSAEPGLDAWWNTVVQIMTEVYKAERVTLAVPADSTDIENVPWGQKATYNAHQEDELSLGYLSRGSSMIPGSTGEIPEMSPYMDEAFKHGHQIRPGILSRHSFTSYEDKKAKRVVIDKASTATKRPLAPSRSKSYFPDPSAEGVDSVLDSAHLKLNKRTLEEHDAHEEQQDIVGLEGPLIAERDKRRRVLPVLQALDYEADPLIDHNGVLRVLERGKVIALTRNYPYLDSSTSDQPAVGKEPPRGPSPEQLRRKTKQRADTSTSKTSTFFGGPSAPRTSGRITFGQTGDAAKMSGIMSRIEDDVPRPPTPKYEEYEQAPPSPWSQSPAPSPAVRADPTENPFFTDAMVDEDSFNPSPGPHDYSAMSPPEAIGVDNSWTVLHIPLSHVLLSKASPVFKLDSTIMEQKLNARGRTDVKPDEPATGKRPSSNESSRREKHAPIAILSVLSPVIPYPSNLRHSLEHLAPHLATSFSLCRHYSNLETELNGIQRKRPDTAGFGALSAGGRPLVDAASVAGQDYLPGGEAASQSLGGSITSPSDYSGPSRSFAGSPSGTPGFESGNLGLIFEKRASGSSPAQVGGDSYFNTRPKSALGRLDTTSPGAVGRARKNSKEGSPSDRKPARASGGKAQLQDPYLVVTEASPPTTSEEGPRRSLDESFTGASQQKRVSMREAADPAPDEKEEKRTTAESRGIRGISGRQDRQDRHTMLHSYGADFATTFPSLPPSSMVGIRSPAAPSRTGSMSTDLPPPSDRLKGLILDSLPTHVFVALPQTGEIVWVNSRYLAYRGQEVADLAANPWGSLHPEDRDEYLKDWAHCLRTGESLSRTVRIKRFDNTYRWFYARAVASRDKRGVIVQYLGSYMDIHDQHIAELRAARQEEIEASEAKHRLLANLIPQIIFTATEDEGITFANDQWLSYTGQSFDDSLGLGFMDYVHPDDLAKCRIPTDRSPTPIPVKNEVQHVAKLSLSSAATLGKTAAVNALKASQQVDLPVRGIHEALSRNNSWSSGSMYGLPSADLSELAKKGIIKVNRDSSGRLSYTTEVRLRSKSGEYRWHLVRCVEIDNIDFGNGASNYFGSATDINDHKLLEAKLKEAMESKSRFLSNMSHEIRTPLIGISGMVSFLQDTVLNEEQRDYTNTIQTSANSLLMIINDILDLSKVDAGMMKLSHEWFHTRSLIEDVNELVSTMAIAKRLELNYIVDEDVPAWVKGDKVRIRQVLLNVIGNAIKFTAEGEVFSRCRVCKAADPGTESSGIMLEFAVIDTGRGFTKEESELIFKPFSQIDGSSTRQHGGSGLGLVISKQLVELHGGQMHGTAVPGKGSTFTFTARFGLPTSGDHPDVFSPPAQPEQAAREEMAENYKQLALSRPTRTTPAVSPTSEPDFVSPALASSGSSDPSIRSSQTQVTQRSSMSSVNAGLSRFSEAARASGQDLSQMKLEMPSGRSSPGTTPTGNDQTGKQVFRPPMYSILIICPQTHSREATTKHIEMTLPKDIPHQITALASVAEAERFISGDDPVIFTHIVLNLPSPEELVGIIGKFEKAMASQTTTVILSDSVQRQAVGKLAAETHREELLSEERVTFIYKPVKPSRFAVIFDPAKERDHSIDRNRSTAQRIVENQKQSYLEVEKRMGNKGYMVLLVEDNPVNQKVLVKYLKKVGVEVDLAGDGVECIEKVLHRPHEYYSLILCDLHMPRKDGYQACREMREWEQENNYSRKPIIALSANVMSDVQEKCMEAGFSDYVTKPVDFIDLSNALSKFF